MSYKYITKYSSKNYTKGKDSKEVFGYARKIKGITIHWWGDPKNKPKFQNIVNYLCTNKNQTSAHYVATGTNRQVACIVAPGNVAWHSGNSRGNATTIGIELDPRCRKEDYDVAAELVADIRSAFGDVPIYSHKMWTATACPGKYDIKKIDKLSYTKYSHKTKWGAGDDIKPAEPSKPTTKKVPNATKLPEVRKFKARLTKTEVWDLDTNPNYKSVLTLKKGDGFEAYGSISFNNRTYFVTKWSYQNKKHHGVNANDLVEVLPKPEPEQSPTETPPEQGGGKPVTEKPDYSAENNQLLKTILSLLQGLVDKISLIFK